MKDYKFFCFNGNVRCFKIDFGRFVNHRANITKASYYWRLRKVREAYLETAEQTQTFVEVPSPAIHPVNMTSEHKIAAVIRCRNHLTLEITEQASASFLKTLLGVISNAQ